MIRIWRMSRLKWPRKMRIAWCCGWRARKGFWLAFHPAETWWPPCRWLVQMKNVFDSGERYHRFSTDPLAQIEAEKGADDAGQVVLGYYHSHPDHPAIPSEYDRTHVPPWSFYSHIIVAIEKGRPGGM